jgi:hypothetical protein
MNGYRATYKMSREYARSVRALTGIDRGERKRSVRRKDLRTVPRADPFETSEFSIAWAKDHIIELKREIEAFFGDEHACGVITEPSANGTYQLFKIRFSKPMPRALRGHASDAAINLRNALDQAVCSVADLCSLPYHTTYFPIADSETLFNNTLKGRCGQLPQEIRDILRRTKPYKGGNKFLWALNKLSGINKHSILRPVAATQELVRMEGFALGIYVWDPPLWDSDKNELIFARMPTGSKYDIEFETAYFIAFNEIEFLDGEEVLAVLNKFVDVVENIVVIIKGESKRIGLW